MLGLKMKREKKNVLVLIVLNYNDAFTTMQFVNSIKEFECISKILIVDNSSTDNSIIKLQKIVNEKIELIVSSRNEGYATGNNIGIKYAKIKWNPDLICIANPDIIIEERTISRISNFIREHKEAAKQGSYHHTQYINGPGNEQFQFPNDGSPQACWIFLLFCHIQIPVVKRKRDS